MSKHILELRTAIHADGTETLMYRVGTEDWVDVSDFKETATAEQPDGRWVPQRAASTERTVYRFNNGDKVTIFQAGDKVKILGSGARMGVSSASSPL